MQNQVSRVAAKKEIGVEGFEPPAPWSQTTYSTKLSHTPITNKNYYI